MTTPLPTTEILRQPALAVEAPLQLSGEWFNQLCLWLQCRIGSLGAIGWPMVLIPELIDRRFRASQDALQVYLRVTWSAPVPSDTFTVGADVGWVSSKGGSVELGLRSRAVRDGAELATSLLVMPAASVLEVCRSEEDESIWAFRLVSTGDVAAVTRIT